jgi:hydroxymethylbilane synthase
MAVHQAEQVADALEALHPKLETVLVRLTTAGDQWTGNLADLGGKGAFVKEIDRALIDDDADLAVHCLKDVPGDLPTPTGLAFAGYLAREDVRDAVVSRSGAVLAELPEGSIIGTSSVRRTAQLRARFPHLRIQPMRGNINTRLALLDEGNLDALIAAAAGLSRVRQAHCVTELLPLETMTPAVGAAIIALRCRDADAEVLDLGARLNDLDTKRQADAERAMLYTLQGQCNSPIAGYASLDEHGELCLVGKVFSIDGTQCIESHKRGPADQAEALGCLVGADLLSKGAGALVDAGAR